MIPSPPRPTSRVFPEYPPAFRRVCCLLLLLPPLGGGCRSAPAAAPSHARVAAPGFAPAFQDVSEAAGIRFTHYNGAFGKKLFPEIMGSGVAWLDADGDGYLDLYFVNGASLPGDPQPRVASNRFYHNNGNGTFSDWTRRAGLGGSGYGMGVAVADIDRDGDSDLYVTNLGINRLYRNRGDGTYEEITSQAGVGGRKNFSSSAAFLDYDNDGYPDLYVCNYVVLPDPLDRIICLNPRKGHQYCDVHVYAPERHTLYHNNGDGTFTDVSVRAGIARHLGRGLAVVCGDYDDDGDQDIFVANDENPAFLWRNNGNGTFTESGAEAGAAYDDRGESMAGMGADLGDYDRDGHADLYVSNFQEEPNVLFHNEGSGWFTNVTSASGTSKLTRARLGFGLGFLDYDLDGWLDLFITNGHVIDDITTFNPHIPYEQTAQLLRNRGNGTFSDASPALGSYAAAARVGRGVAFGDYDNDGDTDLVLANNHQGAALLRNESSARSHWVTIACEGRASNRDGIGTKVTVEAGGVRQVDEVRAASSYLSSSDLRLNFGLGKSGKVDRLQLRWPKGTVDTVSNLAADRIWVVREGSGEAVAWPKAQQQRVNF